MVPVHTGGALPPFLLALSLNWDRLHPHAISIHSLGTCTNLARCGHGGTLSLVGLVRVILHTMHGGGSQPFEAVTKAIRIWMRIRLDAEAARATFSHAGCLMPQQDTRVRWWTLSKQVSHHRSALWHDCTPFAPDHLLSLEECACGDARRQCWASRSHL